MLILHKVASLHAMCGRANAELRMVRFDWRPFAYVFQARKAAYAALSHSWAPYPRLTRLIDRMHYCTSAALRSLTEGSLAASFW